MELLSTTSITTDTKRGILTIAGSGISSIAHITLETLSYLKEAEKVYYVICDPATEVFIQDNTKGTCFDLSVFYDVDKNRYDTYIQMCEVMLRDVRAGYSVMGIFYGHPGVFVSPTHRAIAIAREEGYRAKMLPGISAEDILFADLGIDPAINGCTTYEATELLMRERVLNPSVHNIIWQVGSVGVTTMVFDNTKFGLLVDRLEKDFGPEHNVVHYIGAVLPQSVTVMDIFKIADLRKEEVVEQFNTLSTLYVPPRDVTPAHDAMTQKLGLSNFGKDLTKPLRPEPMWSGSAFPTTPAYGPYEREVIAKIDAHTTPDRYRVLRVSPAGRKLLVDLALNQKLLEEYKIDPKAVVEARDGLSDQEKFALGSGREGPIYALMKPTLADVKSGRDTQFDPGMAAAAFVLLTLEVVVILV